MGDQLKTITMQYTTLPLITVITILGIITLLFFVNDFFRKYKIVKKKKPRKRKTYPKPIKLTNEELNDIIFNDKKSSKIFTFDRIKYYSELARIIIEFKNKINKIPDAVSLDERKKIRKIIHDDCMSKILKIQIKWER